MFFLIWLSSLFFHVDVTVVSASNWKVAMAPTILHHPKAEVAYKPGEHVTLTCIADTDSNPVYEWKKDGIPLNVSGGEINMLSGSGSIVIRVPSEADDGVYQCFARNQFGTALSSKATVKRGVLDPFPTVYQPALQTPVLGKSLTLRCSSPKSYPKGNSYWGINRPNKLEAIENTDRIMLDYEGNLHFANVVPADSLDGTTYVCIVNNAVLGAYVQGNDQSVMPTLIEDGPTYYAPQLLWSSPLMDVAVKGQTKRIKCIFGGLPTPKVTWRRLGQLMSSRAIVTPGGHGTELEINSVELEDAGQYECIASNSGSGNSSTIITIAVHAAPFWSLGRSPSNVQVEEESNVTVDCQAHGTPKPEIHFLVNGVPIEDLPHNPRRSVAGHKVMYRNISTSNSQVIQCIATNEHGSILANIIVSVVAAPPSFIETPSDVKVVEGQKALFRCHAYGAPKPKIVWGKGASEEPLSGNRFINHSSGSLEILDTRVSDSGGYKCHAYNKFGTDDVTVHLTVRLPTRISQVTEKKTVNASDHVVLPCEVESDPAELSDLVVEWHMNNETIDFTSTESHLQMNVVDFSLVINQARVNDTAAYSCHARSRLDSAESHPVWLTVRGHPDSPYDVRVEECSANHSVVSWKAGSDNNSPFVEFEVFYNVSINGSDLFVKGAVIAATEGSGYILQGQKVKAELFSIRPWSAYAFYVTARNLLGVSDPSPLSSELCVTPQVAPEKNPDGVCSRLRGSTRLVIVWEAVPESEWNGDGFHYIVSYRLLNSTLAPERRVVQNPYQAKLVIHGVGTFLRYEIYVQSANNIGVTPISDNEKKIGYSGEGKPQDSPTNFTLTAVNSTYAEFTWDAVDTNPERVRGFFQGYRIMFWRSADPDNVRKEDIIVTSTVDLCPRLESSRHRSIRSAVPVSGSTHHLWPFSRITAGIQVINLEEAGPLSNTISFQTPEGIPGRVSLLSVTERGSSHLRVEWNIPVETNGIVIGYSISYLVAPPAVSKLQTIYIGSSPTPLFKKLLNLEYSTVYMVYVSAVTAAGPGESAFVLAETLPAGAPDKPVIKDVDTGIDSASVVWIPSNSTPPVNPGCRFHLKYRWKSTDNENLWNQVDIDPESDDDWVNVTGLEVGFYEFQMVAINSFEDSIRENRSAIATAYVGPNQEMAAQIPLGVISQARESNGTNEGAEEDFPGVVRTAPSLYEKVTSDWFIILMCFIGVLLLILIIFCITQYSRGDMYPVSEKEKMCGHDPYAPDDVPFGEYSRTSHPDKSRSQLSLESDEKAMDSDSNSLEEYEDADAMKFNEDGSFIGLYSGRNKDQKRVSELMLPSALDTFV